MPVNDDNDYLGFRVCILEEPRPPSANKGDLKKGKVDGAAGRSSSVNPRRLTTGRERQLLFEEKRILSI